LHDLSSMSNATDGGDMGLAFDKPAFMEMGFWFMYVQRAIEIVINMTVAAMLYLLFYCIARGVTRCVAAIMKNPKRPIDADIQPFILKTLAAFLWMQFIPVVIGQIGIDTTALLAIITNLTLAVAFSLRPMVENFVMGMSLVLLKPFQLGEVVQAGGVPGTVREIKATYTLIGQPDGNLIYVPNAKILGGSVVNFSKAGKARIDVGGFPLAHTVNLDVARKTMLEALAKLEIVLQEPKPAMIVTELTALSVVVAARVWVDPSKMPPAPFVVREAVVAAFLASADVPIARSPLAGGSMFGGGGGIDGDAAEGGNDEEAMVMAAMTA